MAIKLPHAKSVARNPTQAEMREWTVEYMPRIIETEFGNLSYKALIKARLSKSTFFVDDNESFKPAMSRAEYEEWAAKQDAYIADKDMILIEGYIGPDPDFRTASRLYMEKTSANIPAMQQQLFFPKDDAYEPEFTVIYTPGLPAPGKSDDRLIAVDHENYVTRVFGSDYFGESKMGGLRMWNYLVYEKGGLALHSGLKTFPDVDGEEKVALILGLSGTGKTTTTFRQQLGSLPVQDDFVGLFPGGKVYSTENGCFAKTFGLDEDDEPTIYGGTTRPDAWLENTHTEPDGKVDFFDDSYTANGRSTFPLANIRHRDPKNLPPVNYLLLLNRNENIIPAVAKLKREQAAAYFMLGETKGTSAGGAAEAGKSLRVPGPTRSSSRTTRSKDNGCSSCSRPCRTSRSTSCRPAGSAARMTTSVPRRSGSSTRPPSCRGSSKVRSSGKRIPTSATTSQPTCRVSRIPRSSSRGASMSVRVGWTNTTRL